MMTPTFGSSLASAKQRAISCTVRGVKELRRSGRLIVICSRQQAGSSSSHGLMLLLAASPGAAKWHATENEHMTSACASDHARVQGRAIWKVCWRQQRSTFGPYSNTDRQAANLSLHYDLRRTLAIPSPKAFSYLTSSRSSL
jgi:hypothetical protein